MGCNPTLRRAVPGALHRQFFLGSGLIAHLIDGLTQDVFEIGFQVSNLP